jgi:hypothetical protein
MRHRMKGLFKKIRLMRFDGAKELRHARKTHLGSTEWQAKIDVFTGCSQ